MLSVFFSCTHIFIPLDIFTESLHNKGINNDLDAWLAFLSSDEPEIIATLTEYAPIFADMYCHLYEICENVEGVMKMFSKELQILDRNTVQLMIDEMQDDITQLTASNAEKDNTISEQKNTIAERDNTIAELKAQLAKYQNPDDPK